MGAVTVRVVHVNHREHGGCVNDVVDWSLPVRELPPPRGDEQVQHLHNEKLAPQGHPASPVPPWPRTRLQVTCGGRAPHAANSTVVSTPVANRRGPATYLLPRPWPARADIRHCRLCRHMCAVALRIIVWRRNDCTSEPPCHEPHTCSEGIGVAMVCGNAWR